MAVQPVLPFKCTNSEICANSETPPPLFEARGCVLIRASSGSLISITSKLDIDEVLNKLKLDETQIKQFLVERCNRLSLLFQDASPRAAATVQSYVRRVHVRWNLATAVPCQFQDRFRAPNRRRRGEMIERGRFPRFFSPIPRKIQFESSMVVSAGETDQDLAGRQFPRNCLQYNIIEF
jgi:hypothetical protein